MSRRLRLTAALLLCLAYSLPVSAAENLPESSDDASVVEAKIRREQEAPEAIRRELIIEDQTEKPAAPPDSAMRFYVKKISLTGSTVIPPARFKDLLSANQGRDMTLTELETVASRITDEYRMEGYITSIAYVPEQKIEDGEVVIRVVEGRIGDINVEGNRWFRARTMRRYLPLKQGDVLHYRSLRKGVDRLNQNRDREVKSILRKGQKPETTDILLKVKDHFPLHGSLIFDNQGSRSSGQKRYGGNLNYGNLTGLDDSLTAGTVFGQRFGALFSRYDLPVLPRHGTSLFGTFSHVQVHPKKELTDFGVNGISRTYSAGIRQPAYRTARFNLDTELSFDFKESRTKVLSGTFRRERLRVLRFSHDISYLDRLGDTYWDQNYAWGIDGLGAVMFADPGSSRQNIDPDFFKMYGNILRRVKMPYKTTFQSKLVYQIVSDKVSSSEGLYMGGGSTVRGYPEGDYIADTGFYFNLEYFIPVFFVPEEIDLPFTRRPLKGTVDLVAFFDHGFGKLRGPSGSEVKERHLMGVGGGIRVRVYQNLFARLEWAQAVGDHPLTDTGRGEFHFRLQTEI